VNGSDTLEGNEILQLAEWVWCSFRPGQEITLPVRDEEAEKILKRCDVNGDGAIDKYEFRDYYEQTAAAMAKFHKANAKKKSKSPSPMASPEMSHSTSSEVPPPIPGVGKESEKLSPDAKQEVVTLTGRALKKFNQLDENGNGTLTGYEVLQLAEWVWCSFRPGQTITDADKAAEGAKILKRCDVNGDGAIDKYEFQDYYEQTAAAMAKFHKVNAKKKSKSPSTSSSPSMGPKGPPPVPNESYALKKLPHDAKQEVVTLTGRALKKWNQLDVNGNGTLEGNEILQLAEWVCSSFGPGESSYTPSKEEAEMILKRCDVNGDGKIDKREFRDYYEQTAAAMAKFHKANAKKSPSPSDKSKSPSRSPEEAEAPSAADLYKAYAQDALSHGRSASVEHDDGSLAQSPPVPVESWALKQLSPDAKQEVVTLTGRALKKWNKLDVNGSDTLEGNEILQLAEWVWCSFRPGQEITLPVRDEEANKILKRCDVNGDGAIDKYEFRDYYEQTAAAMAKFHKANAKKESKSPPSHPKAKKVVREESWAIKKLPPAEKREVQFKTSLADKKFRDLDVDRNRWLDGSEVLPLAEWVCKSHRPGEVIGEAEKEAEAASIMRNCDIDRNGKIDQEEFRNYYEHTAAALSNFHVERGVEAISMVRSQDHASLSPPPIPEARWTEEKWLEEAGKLSSPEDRAARAMFQAMDTSRDGRLSHKELKRHLKTHAWAASVTTGEAFHWKDFFKEADTDQDGSIDEEEFNKLYKNFLAPLLAVNKDDVTDNNVPEKSVMGVRMLQERELDRYEQEAEDLSLEREALRLERAYVAKEAEAARHQATLDERENVARVKAVQDRVEKYLNQDGSESPDTSQNDLELENDAKVSRDRAYANLGRAEKLQGRQGRKSRSRSRETTDLERLADARANEAMALEKVLEARYKADKAAEIPLSPISGASAEAMRNARDEMQMVEAAEAAEVVAIEAEERLLRAQLKVMDEMERQSNLNRDPINAMQDQNVDQNGNTAPNNNQKRGGLSSNDPQLTSAADLYKAYAQDALSHGRSASVEHDDGSRIESPGLGPNIAPKGGWRVNDRSKDQWEAGSLMTTARRRMIDLFDYMDVNKDGYIDRDEFRRAIAVDPELQELLEVDDGHAKLLHTQVEVWEGQDGSRKGHHILYGSANAPLQGNKNLDIFKLQNWVREDRETELKLSRAGEGSIGNQGFEQELSKAQELFDRLGAESSDDAMPHEIMSFDASRLEPTPSFPVSPRGAPSQRAIDMEADELLRLCHANDSTGFGYLTTTIFIKLLQQATKEAFTDAELDAALRSTTGVIVPGSASAPEYIDFVTFAAVEQYRNFMKAAVDPSQTASQEAEEPSAADLYKAYAQGALSHGRSASAEHGA